MTDDVKFEYLEDKVEDHEERLRKVEKNTMEMKYELLNITKSQSDIKSLVLETNKEQSKTLNNMAKMIESNISTNNQIRLIDRKELWGILALVIGGVVGRFLM